MEANATSSSDRSCAKCSSDSLPSLASISEETDEQVSGVSSSSEPTAPDSLSPHLSASVRDLIEISRNMSALAACGIGGCAGAPVRSESASSAAQGIPRSSTSENLPSISELHSTSDSAEFDIISDPAVLQVFHSIPENGAPHPKEPTPSEGKLQAHGQMDSPLSPGQISDDPAVLSVLSLPPGRKEPPTALPSVCASTSLPPAREPRDDTGRRRNDSLPPIQVPTPASETFVYVPNEEGFFSPPYVMPTAASWSVRPVNGFADYMPSRMSLYDMDDKFFPPRVSSLIEEEMSRGMNTPPPPPDHRQSDRLFVMVNVEEVPLAAADLVYVVEMFDGVRPLVAFALPLGVHNSVFGTDGPERAAPSRLILLLPQGASRRTDTHRRYQLRVRTFEAVPLNEAAFTQMLLSRPQAPSKPAKLKWNSFSIRPEDPFADAASARGVGATPLNAITASRSLLSERFRFDENCHLVPMQLPNGIKCFLCVDLAQHCRRNVLFQVHNHQQHYGEPPRPRHTPPRRHEKPPPSRAVEEEQPAIAVSEEEQHASA